MFDQNEMAGNLANSTLITIDDELIDFWEKAPLSGVAYKLVYTEGVVPGNVPEEHLDLWIRICKGLTDALLGIAPSTGKVSPKHIREHLCKNVLGNDDPFFRVLRAVLVRAFPGCPKLPDAGSLKKELLDKKSEVKSKMDLILKALLHTRRRDRVIG